VLKVEAARPERADKRRPQAEACYYTCPDRLRGKDGSPGTEGRKIVVSKMQSLRWLENLKRSQRLTAREERRKEEIMEIFYELYDISLRYEDPPVFPPWHPSW
jgi:hypothetical protein